MRTGNKILFCSPRIKIATYHQPWPFFLSVAVRASTRIIACRLFFQICAVWAGLSLGAVWLYATLAQRDRSDGQMWKNVAHQTQTRGKMLFFPLCVISKSYHQLLFFFVLVVGADKEEYIRQQRRPEKD